MNSKIEICKAFDQHAAQYEQAAKVQYEIGLRLFERLDYLKITPRYILDLGCGTGIFSPLLKKKYPKALVVSLDLAHAMLLQARKKQSCWRKWPLIQADMMKLPFAPGIFDLVFANQVIHWSESLPEVFSELNRVMNTQACLMFSTLGPDTFKEIKIAWSGANSYSHTNIFADMHDIGDYLLRERFADPVVDMELLTLQYTSLSKLVQALKAQGVRHINPARNPGLTGRKSWQNFEEGYQKQLTPEGKYPLTYEVVYGHAWKAAQRRFGNAVETFIPVSSLSVKKM